MSVPSATLLAAIVALIVISADPLNDAEPLRSPPNEIVLAVANVVAVSALPVTSPVTSPSRFATRVPVVIERLPVLAPVLELEITGEDIKGKYGNPDLDPYESDNFCLLYTSPSPRDGLLSRMPSSA